MDFSNPHFEEPHWLWLCLAGPIALAALHQFAARARRKQLAQLASPAFVKELTASHSPARRAIKQSLLLLASICLALAMARPQWGVLNPPQESMGEDVLFCLDCSRSMLATDVLPSRLQRAKFAILDFVQRRAQGRVGLVAFAGSAFLQCPLTFDYDSFADALRAADDKTIPVPGTDVGRALEESYRAMPKTSSRKIVVLVTDGEDLEQTGVASAKALAREGVVVFAIGVGTPAGKQIQFLDASGQTEWVRDPGGELVLSQLDEKTLRSIAQATGGNYYPLGRLGDGLARVEASIRSLGTTTTAPRVRVAGVERFHVPLAVAMVLVVLESLLGTRRRMG